MQTPGLRAQSLIWLGLEMRKHARHSGLIEDAPLPAWSIHYLWVFTNFNWHFYQLWMSVSESATLGVSVLPLTRWKYCVVSQSKTWTVGCTFPITFYMCDLWFSPVVSESNTRTEDEFMLIHKPPICFSLQVKLTVSAGLVINMVKT